MAWNEPGGGNRDPWNGSGKDQGPPDLDEVLRKLQNRVRSLFGGKPPHDGNGNDGGAGGGGAGFAGIGLLIGILLVVWLLSGIYIIDEGKRGVVLRFGAYQTTVDPGLHWRIPYPIDEVRIVDIETVRSIEIGYEVLPGGRTRERLNEALMLTSDENIVNVHLAVHYQVSDPEQYLFEFRDPDGTVKELAESAIREIVGKRQLDYVLTEGREEVAASAHELIQEVLDEYKIGLNVNRVAIQDVQPPEEVQGSFADAIRAREDEQRFINEARAYRNEVLPRADGEAARQLEEALGYRDRVIARAEGESARFLALLTEYQRAPGVTRERLYIDALEQVLQRSSKIFIDVENGQPLMYLPLDKMTGRDGRGGDAGSQSLLNPPMPSSATTGSGTGGGNQSNPRARETR
ncbi:HflK protein [Alkalilimnicola ehrlichii]|uniref:Protein HflK n=1 Tax=Alkalilimnicola ehrlichii TaxID=351052 RepID=A0A3E0X1H8_9GAMM|nr:FtsH protease activity modulator HflK [Alkalilimnicola ehrlichii]RFA30465.1 HflK protein [Alkalilimnicola ehrlichii]RFA38017.1 HflK protein [Alkalilimnicola ehrlichii]